MYSSERVQKVVFVRHGVAKHNIPDPTTGKAPNVRDPAMTDPSLVYQGKQQALHAGHRFQQWWQTTQQGNNVELVITSVSSLSLFSLQIVHSFTTKESRPKLIIASTPSSL